MKKTDEYEMYPLKFEPIYQYRIWGGRRLEHILSKPLPKDELIGEAWILSDRENYSNEVVEGSLGGRTLTELMRDFHEEIMGNLRNLYKSFPLLLKFLDCHEVLSVQVHPSDDQKELIPPGDTGKTEGWVVLETAENSRIYAGLKKGITKKNLLKAVEDKTLAESLHSFIPKKNDAVFIHSGTVHTLKGTVVFEVQENSDTTFRLYDWDRIDSKTGKPRDLQIKKAMASIDFNQTEIEPVIAQRIEKNKDVEIVFDNNHFKLWRIHTKSKFTVGIEDEPVVLVCTEGKGVVEFHESSYTIGKGEVLLFPAIIGQLDLKPDQSVTLLQIAISNKTKN